MTVGQLYEILRDLDDDTLEGCEIMVSNAINGVDNLTEIERVIVFEERAVGAEVVKRVIIN